MNTVLSVHEIEQALVHFFDPRKQLAIVPNVTYGFFKTHEADLVVLSKSGYITEVEIKRSWSDFVADFSKHTNHFEGKVFHLYYAVPETIASKVLDYINDHTWPEPYSDETLKKFYGPPVGVYTYDDFGNIREARKAPDLSGFTRSNQNEYKLYLEEQNKLMRLGCLRLWKVGLND